MADKPERYVVHISYPDVGESGWPMSPRTRHRSICGRYFDGESSLGAAERVFLELLARNDRLAGCRVWFCVTRDGRLMMQGFRKLPDRKKRYLDSRKIRGCNGEESMQMYTLTFLYPRPHGAGMEFASRVGKCLPGDSHEELLRRNFGWLFARRTDLRGFQVRFRLERGGEAAEEGERAISDYI